MSIDVHGNPLRSIGLTVQVLPVVHTLITQAPGWPQTAIAGRTQPERRPGRQGDRRRRRHPTRRPES